MRNHNRIGLIGGVGPASTMEYYRLIIKRFQDRLNTTDYPDFIIKSVNMTEMISYVFNNQFDRLVNFLSDRIKILEQAGVDYGAIAANTPHIVFDRLAERVSIPLISIVEETCKAIAGKSMKRVALFGTKPTMTKGFYHKVGEKYGIGIVIPDLDQQDFIHDKYMKELVYNNIIPETKQQLIEIVKGLKQQEMIEGLILGGTELPLILNQSDFEDLQILDTTKIHVESIVTRMIEN